MEPSRPREPLVEEVDRVETPVVGVQVESTGLAYERTYVGGLPSDDEVKEDPEDSDGAILSPPGRP